MSAQLKTPKSMQYRETNDLSHTIRILRLIFREFSIQPNNLSLKGNTQKTKYDMFSVSKKYFSHKNYTEIRAFARFSMIFYIIF